MRQREGLDVTFIGCCRAWRGGVVPLWFLHARQLDEVGDESSGMSVFVGGDECERQLENLYMFSLRILSVFVSSCAIVICWCILLGCLIFVVRLLISSPEVCVSGSGKEGEGGQVLRRWAHRCGYLAACIIFPNHHASQEKF